MALGTAVEGVANPKVNMSAVAPVSLKSAWVVAIDAGGVATQDAATITNPTTQITGSTKHIVARRNCGTHAILRLQYDSTLTAITSPIVKIFGRVGSAEAWQLLYSRAGNLVETLTVDTTNDARDGTYSYTTPSFSTHAWDCLGCDEILVGVQTALAGSTGSTATAVVQLKFI